MRVVFQENRAHWYRQDGTPCFELPYADKKRSGEMRKPTLRDARKLNLLPSVTTIGGMINNEVLNTYRENQAILAAITMPRKPGESDTDFARRVPDDMRAARDDAADIGKNADKAIYLWHSNEEYPVEYAPFVQAFKDFLAHVGGEVCWMQRVIVGEGYAGTADMLIYMRGGYYLFDLKTQDAKEDKKTGRFEFSFWESWPEQLAGYNRQIRGDGIGTIVLDRTRKGEWDFKVYSAEDEKLAAENFMAARVLYRNRNRYWPENKALGLVQAAA